MIKLEKNLFIFFILSFPFFLMRDSSVWYSPEVIELDVDGRTEVGLDVSAVLTE